MCLWYELTATLWQKKVASKLSFTKFPYKSIVALRFSGGYVCLLGIYFWGRPDSQWNHVKPIRWARVHFWPYSLKAGLRFAYGRDSYFCGSSRSLQLYNKWNRIRRWSLVILKIHLRQPYGCGTNFMHDLRQTLWISYELQEKAYEGYEFKDVTNTLIWNLERCSSEVAMHFILIAPQVYGIELFWFFEYEYFMSWGYLDDTVSKYLKVNVNTLLPAIQNIDLWEIFLAPPWPKSGPRVHFSSRGTTSLNHSRGPRTSLAMELDMPFDHR